jgi:hypothetical protein
MTVLLWDRGVSLGSRQIRVISDMHGEVAAKNAGGLKSGSRSGKDGVATDADLIVAVEGAA